MELVLATPPGGENSNADNKVNVCAKTFGRDYNEPLVHQVITAYLAGGRSGDSAQKTRSEVSGGGAKPWRQKGTGRARAGTIRSPLWRSGGRAFAAKPRDYSQKVNRKMYRGAMCSILSELVRQKRLMIVNEIAPKVPKTRELLNNLKAYNLTEALIIVDHWDHNLYLASRNLPNVFVRQVTDINPVCLVKSATVVITTEAVQQLAEVLK